MALFQPESPAMSTNVEPILTFVRRRLDESRGEWVEISRVSGVPYHTLTKIAQGATPNPRIETVQRLVDHFKMAQRIEQLERPSPRAVA